MDVWKHLHRIATDAGFEIVADAVGILYCREVISAEDVFALTADDITSLYEGFVGPAIDRMEAWF